MHPFAAAFIRLLPHQIHSPIIAATLEMRSARFFSLSVTIALVVTSCCVPLFEASASRPSAMRPTREKLEFEQRLEVRALAATNGVLVEWSASFENATLGFNVYRIRSGSRTQLNSSLIAGGALI